MKIASSHGVLDRVSAWLPPAFGLATDKQQVLEIDRLSGGGDWIVLPAGGHGTDMLEADPALGGQIVDWILEIAG